MRIVKLLAAPAMAAALFIASPLAASAKLLINIDKSSQTMTVSQDGNRLYSWPVSTGIRAYDTPGGSYTPFRMEKDHFSKEWDDAPMPNSIFFTTRGHAIHGTNHTTIGRPASHGCVRLSVAHSATLFALVKQVGMANTKVVLGGEIPPPAPAVARAPRSIEPQPRSLEPPRSLQPPQQAYQQRYARPNTEDQDDGYQARPRGYGEPGRFGENRGYWLYPDGRRVYVDRAPDPRVLPVPPQSPYGWQ